MATPFYDLSDANLLIWAQSLAGHLVATPGAYHITADQAAELQGKVLAFEEALSVWRDPTTQTPVASRNKSAAREALLGSAKYLVNTINSNPQTSDAQRDELGIRKRKARSTIDAPAVSPLIDVAAVVGNVVSVRLITPGRRGRPVGTQGAILFTHIGDEPPTDASQHRFHSLTTRTNVEITFPTSTRASTVWIVAHWYNERGELGAPCSPKRVNLPACTDLPTTDNIKLAA